MKRTDLIRRGGELLDGLDAHALIVGLASRGDHHELIPIHALEHGGGVQVAAILQHIAVDLDDLVARLNVHAAQCSVGIHTGNKAGHLLSVLVASESESEWLAGVPLDLDPAQILHHVVPLVDLSWERHSRAV